MIDKVDKCKERCFIFYKQSCAYCHKAMIELDSIRITYESFEVSSEQAKNMLVKETGHNTFPQIFINKKFIGGYNELMILIMTNKIYTMLEMCPDF